MARILIIEDNPENLELMTYLLKKFGHATSVAVDGEHGIEMARTQHPDLILCDIHLPGMDGYTVVRHLRVHVELGSIPIIAVSALAMEGDREKGLTAGFDDYISKPIDPESFVARIDSFLHAHHRGVAPPQQAGSDTPVASADPQALPTHKARVVFLDDSPTNCELIYQTLSPSGYEVLVAEDVHHALELVKSNVPDLILSDLHLPGEDGFEFVRKVKADPLLAKIPFVFLSSSVWGEPERQKAMKFGVTRFLVRPIEPATLLLEIAAALARRGVT